MISRVHESRRSGRTPLECPARLLDGSGRVLVDGRAIDVAKHGIRIRGSHRLTCPPGQRCWVELSLPTPFRSGPRRRVVKLSGQVRRCIGREVGEPIVVVVVLDSDFARQLLAPLA